MQHQINKKKFTNFQGPKHRQRFLCEVRLPGFRYVGVGNSTNKKDSEKNASRDFVNFLARDGKISEQDIPGNEGDANNQQQQQDGGMQSQDPRAGGGYQGQSSSSSWNQGGGNLSNFQPDQLGQAYRPAQYENSNNANFGFNSVMDRAREQARVEEAESLDVNAAIHGNWTVENAKTKLNMYMQSNRITGEYKYSAVGPDHNK